MTILRVAVENPEELLNAGSYGAGALIRIQTSATQVGTFANISGTGSTPTIPIVAATRMYLGYDPAGVASSWYRIRYESADTLRVSEWAAAFQAGDETTGLLCSLYDVKQRMFGTSSVTSNEDELLLDIIREVSDDIEDYVGAWLAPRPLDPASTMALLFDIETAGRVVYLKSGGRRAGIRTLASLGIAYTSQPESGGSYTTVTLADVLLRPRPTADAPASRLEFTDYPTGGIGCFYAGYNTVSAVGSFGPAAVSPRIQGIAIAAVTRRYLGKETASPAIALGPDGGVRLLADISPGMKATLDRMSIAKVA